MSEPANLDWQSIDTAPDGEVVMTKIDDRGGPRNVQSLERTECLWINPAAQVRLRAGPLFEGLAA